MNTEDMIKELKRQKRNSLRRIDRQIKKVKEGKPLTRSNIIDRIKSERGNPLVQLLKVLEKDRGISCFRGKK